MDQAKSQDIPVIAFDSGVESDVPLTTAATDNKAAAAEAAKHMSELIGGKGKVALVVHDQTSQTGIERRDGFIEWMKANAPDIELLPRAVRRRRPGQVGRHHEVDHLRQPRPQGLLRRQRGLGDRRSSRASRRAARRASRSSASTRARRRSTRSSSGVMAGAITQNPVGMGKELVASAMKAIKGEQLPKVIDTGFYWYDKTNIDDPKIQAVLYE